MVATPISPSQINPSATGSSSGNPSQVAPSPITALIHPQITWEKLPEGFQLDETPVENTGQPLIAGALRESLELAQWIQPEMLIASNFGLCATVNQDLIIKAPDWLYIPQVADPEIDERNAYTPQLEGDRPAVVMEFISHTDGGEYSVKRTFPPGKWFFYEQILQVPTYVIFDADGGLLEVYTLENERYTLESSDENGRHWIASMNLWLGTWRGPKEERDGYWLRWWNPDGELLPWALEKVAQIEQAANQAKQAAEAERQRAEAERQRAEAECQRAEAECQRADRLAELLRQQGIDPDLIS